MPTRQIIRAFMHGAALLRGDSRLGFYRSDVKKNHAKAKLILVLYLRAADC